MFFFFRQCNITKCTALQQILPLDINIKSKDILKNVIELKSNHELTKT